jgi:hypothetical protein
MRHNWIFWIALAGSLPAGCARNPGSGDQPAPTTALAVTEPTDPHSNPGRDDEPAVTDMSKAAEPAVPAPSPGDDEAPPVTIDFKAIGPADRTPVDNSRCHVCHLNYDDEPLAVSHALHGVGCEMCHGRSDAHCSDENNITPPEIMFAADAIAAACAKCHVQLSDQHQTYLTEAAEPQSCTDCHDFADHRLGYRTRRWDKKTGELLECDGVRM